MDNNETINNSEVLSAVIAEYTALRSVQRQHLNSHFQLLSIYSSASLVFIGLVVTSKIFDLIHLLPILSLVFIHRLLWEQAVIRTLSEYLSEIESKKIPALLGKMPKEIFSSENVERLWMGWQHHWDKNVMPEHYFRFGMLLVFVVVPFGVSVMFSMGAISSNPWATSVLSVNETTLICIFELISAVWATLKISRM